MSDFKLYLFRTLGNLTSNCCVSKWDIRWILTDYSRCQGQNQGVVIHDIRDMGYNPISHAGIYCSMPQLYKHYNKANPAIQKSHLQLEQAKFCCNYLIRFFNSEMSVTTNDIIHLMSAPEGNSLFYNCFPESLSRDNLKFRP
jgi:hypothetical protein